VTDTTTVPRPATDLEPFVPEGVITLTRSGRQVAADVAVIGAGPAAALVGYAVTGGPAGLVGCGLAGAVAAMLWDAARRRHV